MTTLFDIRDGDRIYRPFNKSMVRGWDKTKSGDRRPWGMVDGREAYLFPEGYVVYDAETGRSLNSISQLPPHLKRAQGGLP